MRIVSNVCMKSEKNAAQVEHTYTFYETLEKHKINLALYIKKPGWRENYEKNI